ncbi:hypothetical protein K435DRAFT_865764 [Dendrothele bispora CBS 962.96]|uniref:Arrestin C-terminal-like domain-containing protein n=1 Tax=Dendrothele bispora (strain CBS 962.96) TaxID=1314807 RepID=A0A4V4HDY8_DENBC|nr:hypothetical protein K435DRAFT_865764 [Dendrothele bispora CBS 962.96]
MAASSSSKPLRPEPMNVTTNHPKVKLSLMLASPLVVAGDEICGKMEMDCRADQGLGIGVMMVELFAFQELHSRDHSATSNFIHLRRFFQGPGLPPSNAVQALPQPGDTPLPPSYFQARRGHSTFLFRLPLPHTSPSSISFGSGLATVRYEIRASVGVSWKGERRVVTEKKEVEVVEAFDEELWGLTAPGKEPEAVVVGENGKIWMQGRVIGGIVVAGETACVELQVKNHSSKKNTGLSVTLTRILHLPETSANTKAPPLEITDTLTTVPFRGPEYIIPPGAEGVASLVFDVPRLAKGVKGGIFLGDVPENLLDKDGNPKKVKESESLFEVRCIVGIKMSMGLGSKDIFVEIPVPIVHPAALPELPPIGGEPQPYPYPPQDPYYPYPAPPISHTPGPYPHHPSQTPGPYPPPHHHAHAHTPQPHVYANVPPERAASAAPYAQYPYQDPNNMPIPMPMSPPPPIGGVYVDPSTGMVWLPPPTGQGYDGRGGEYQGEYYVPPIPPFQHDPHAYYAQEQHAVSNNIAPLPLVPPRPSSAGAQREQQEHGMLSPSPSVPGLPPASTTPGLSALGFGNGVNNGAVDEGSVRHRRRPSGRARSVSPTPSHFNNARDSSPAPVPSGHMASNEMAPRLELGNLPPPSLGLPPSMSSGNANANGTTTPLLSPRPVLSPKQSFTRVTTITAVSPSSSSGHGHGGTLGSTAFPPASPRVAAGSLDPSLPTGGGGEGGGGYFGLGLGLETKEVSKSERVEELERMADEVGKKKKDLSGGDLPRDSVLSAGLEGEDKVKVKVKDGEKEKNKTLPAPPVPTMSDKERFKQGQGQSQRQSRARADEYFAGDGGNETPRIGGISNGLGLGLAVPGDNNFDGNGDGDSTPPTPATPTLMAVASRAAKSSNKPKSQVNAQSSTVSSSKERKDDLLSPSIARSGAGLYVGRGLGKRESGLDALEAKLLAEVGTRKVGTEKKPDVWSVLGQSRAQQQAQEMGTTPKTEKPSPISIPPMKRRDSDVDTSLNDSAISSLTLPDCGEREQGKEGELLVTGLNGAFKEHLDGNVDDDNDNERERDRDSDEKSQKTHKGMNSRNRDEKDESWERKSEKKRKSREKTSKGKVKAAVAKGRVAAWLGNVEADVPPAEDVIAPSPSPDTSDKDKDKKGKTSRPRSPLEGLPVTRSTAQPQKEEEELSVEELLKKEQAELDKADPPKPGQSSPNPRSSGFVPIGTLKRDIYQRTLVPKDSPYATTNNPAEDAKRITDLWSATNLKGTSPTLKANKDVSPPSSPAGNRGNGNETLANRSNPWQSVRSPLFAGRRISGGSKLPLYPPPLSVEHKYDIRSARGGRGGQVTAVASLWASGTNVKEEEKKIDKVKEDVPKPKKLAASSPLKFPVSASSSTSSIGEVPASSNGVGKRSTAGSSSGPGKRPGVKPASALAPTVVSSSHATPTLSSTASLARPPGQSSPPKAKFATKVPLTTISELPSSEGGSRTRASSAGAGNNKVFLSATSSSSMGEAMKPVVSVANKGSAAAGLKAFTGGIDSKSGIGATASKRSSMPASMPSTPPTSTSSAGTGELAFGQARLRDLIRKYQGQAS